MNILLVNYEYKPQCGGAGLGTYNMAKEFSRLGHEVTLLIGWDDTFGQPEMLKDVDTNVIKIKKKNIHQSTPAGLLSFVAKGFRRIHEITKKKKIDIIMFYFCVPTGLLKYGIHGKIPYVISLRGLDIPGLRMEDDKFLSRITKRQNYKIAKNAAAVTCVSAEAGSIYNAFAPDIKIDVIPNAVDITMYKPKEQYSTEVKKLVCVARYIKFKKIDVLIHAMKSLHDTYPDLILDIYGEGREYDAIASMIRELNAGSYVFQRGYATAENLAGLLPTYDAFVLLSVGDSFGLVYIEAMSCGLPVICARAGGPVDIVEDGITGLFAEPEDVEGSARAIRYLVDNPQEAERMGRMARRVVEERYSIGGVAMQHIALFERYITNFLQGGGK